MRTAPVFARMPVRQDVVLVVAEIVAVDVLVVVIQHAPQTAG